jgi:hypothetical protein
MGFIKLRGVVHDVGGTTPDAFMRLVKGEWDSLRSSLWFSRLVAIQPPVSGGGRSYGFCVEIAATKVPRERHAALPQFVFHRASRIRSLQPEAGGLVSRKR